MTAMKLTINKVYENKVLYTISGIDFHVANVIRRYAISKVPVIAIDKAVFYENNSSFFDEYIAHRLGEIPIKTPKNFQKNSTVKLLLDAAGPKKLYSGDILADKDIEPAIPDILLLTLKEGQVLKVECVGVLGVGSTHMKFQASVTSYEQVDDSTFNFFSETTYQKPVKEVIVEAIEILQKDIKELNKIVSKI